MAQDETEEYETMQKEAVEEGGSGLNHLTNTGSGFIKPHCTAVSPPPLSPPPSPSSTEEHNHTQPSAHMGAHVGSAGFGSVCGRFEGGGSCKFTTRLSLMDIVFNNAPVQMLV